MYIKLNDITLYQERRDNVESKELFDVERIKIDLEVENKEDVLKLLFEIMQKSGKVKESFLKSILEREKKFPTGLKIGDFGIAIPHTEPEHINEAGIAVAILKKSVVFQRMDDPDDLVDVKVVFMMALKDGHNHLSMISNIVKMLQTPKVLNKLKNAPSEQDVLSIVCSNL